MNNNASSAPPTTKQEDEDKDKIIADLKNENETLKDKSRRHKIS